MVRINNEDCAWLGCDWDWSTEPCECGRPHTFRICARCLTVDDDETERCTLAKAPRDEQATTFGVAPSVLVGGLPRMGKSGGLRAVFVLLAAADGGAVA